VEALDPGHTQALATPFPCEVNGTTRTPSPPTVLASPGSQRRRASGCFRLHSQRDLRGLGLNVCLAATTEHGGGNVVPTSMA